MKNILFVCTLFFTLIAQSQNPIHGLLERIDKGASKKFIIEKITTSVDFFELDQKDNKVVIRGNNYVSIATGINWYLKYYANIHLSWNKTSAHLPHTLPAVKKKEYHETNLPYRYDFNYCTYSYTMAFWNWERWEKEIDWMALHGINLPLSIIGTDVVWYNVLSKLGYEKDCINQFIAGPAFQAWWLMNNLEGWGGPNPDSWYKQREKLQKKILKRMRTLGIHPVLPGYSGMVPNNAKEKLHLNVAKPGKWCGFRRPAFLQPTDPKFAKIADLYYKEMTRLYGKADFYSMDPFHEGGNTKGVDLNAAGQAIWKAMKKNNPKAIWVAQAWQNNPRPKMIENIPEGDLIVLDLFAESRPQWGEPNSTWCRKNGFGKHNWIFCMLLNYGGNVGLHGKMQHLINSFYKAKNSRFSSTLKGVGMSMEGTENNPVMFELLTELPWRKNIFNKEKWLNGYLKARYGHSNESAEKAWKILSNTIYNCPATSTQQGTHESIFCARPGRNVYQTSSWSEMSDYYRSQDIIDAAGLLLSAADELKNNENYKYDLVDIMRQAIAEKGRLVYPIMMSALKAHEKKIFMEASEIFLNLILLQDELLSTQAAFGVGSWINAARNLGESAEEKDKYEWNARVQITTWGNREASENGGLRDYAHKEWSGILRDLYYKRWSTWIQNEVAILEGKEKTKIDFYTMDKEWAKSNNPYPITSSKAPIAIAQKAYQIISNETTAHKE